MSIQRLVKMFILTVFLFSGVALAETQTVHINNAQPILNKNAEKSVSLDGYGFVREPGQPKLPSRILAVAVPPGATIKDIRIENAVFEDLGVNIEILPAPCPRLILENPADVKILKEHLYKENYDRIYRSDSFFPERIATYVRTSCIRKYLVADIRVTPFQYNPVTGALKYFKTFDIVVDYTISEDLIAHVDDCLPRMEDRASKLIFNYEQAQVLYPVNERSRGLNDFVIVTTDDLINAVQPLVNWEEIKGRTVEVVTVNWINAQYSGVDTAQRMRNFLRDKYPSGEWGIEDVLFVGHHSDVPMRTVDQDVGYGNPRTDFYFAELSQSDDQSWDSNGNGDYCDDYDNMDFYAEVNVGRIPWSDYSTVENICLKSVNYEMNDDSSFKKNILLLGGFFWEDTDNAELMEAKVDQSWMSDWTATRLYEQNSTVYSSYPCDYELTHNNVVNEWSSGTYGFVNWAGHGSYHSCHIMGYGSAAFIESSDCPQLNDDFPAIIFADACSNSDTDYTNIGMKMLQQGGVGFVGATKVALGCPGWSGPLDGSSQSMDYYFTTGVTSHDYSQGASHQNALSTVYQNSGWDMVRYEICEWSLWGNPDLGMGAAISSNGLISLDRTKYAPGTEAKITVRDFDVNEHSGFPDSTQVTLTTLLGDEEILTLNETGFSTCVFENTIDLVEGDPIVGNGIIEVVNYDNITAIYIDEDDGQGGSNVEKSVSAPIDALPPEITNVQVSDVTIDSATISWQTNELATSMVSYGESGPVESESNLNLTQDHEITLTGLESCTVYVFEISSDDGAGNTAIDDNQGAYYQLTTMELILAMEENLNSDPSWTTEGLWEFGQPTGQGGEHGNPDPTSGFTGNSVYGYNLNGDYPNESPEYSLTTGAINCSDMEDVRLSFYRWLGVERNNYDHAYIRISTNGSSWTNIWENEDVEIADSDWIYQEFDISDHADGQSTVYIRWVMGSTDVGWRYCGWNIDDIRIYASGPCNPGETPTPPPTHTPAPTYTPAPPTYTPGPTSTSAPATFTPQPTNTPPGTPTPVPTMTPIPTYTPQPTYTQPPSPTPTTQPGEPTYTPYPTHTPYPTSTPVPTDPPGDMIIELLLNQNQFTSGDEFELKCRCINNGPEIMLDQYLLLDVMGDYFFWPEWTIDLQCSQVLVPEKQTINQNILQFTWPSGVFGTVNGLRFWAALMQPGTTNLIAPVHMVEFGYY